MSHPGLLKFLEGSKPQAATVRKLLGWYVRPVGCNAGRGHGARGRRAACGHGTRGAAEERAGGTSGVAEGSAPQAGTEPPDWLK